jgi:hypothetical protein
MQLGQRTVAQHRLAPAKAHLVEPRARAHQHRKRARADLGVKRAGIALGDAIKLGAAIGDKAGEQIKPPGGAFGIGHRMQPRRQRQMLGQRHHVDAALFKHRAAAQIDPVHLEIGQPLGHAAPGARQKRGAHAVGHIAQPQIERGGLNCPSSST